jgi:hypothetical protein
MTTRRTRLSGGTLEEARRQFARWRKNRSGPRGFPRRCGRWRWKPLAITALRTLHTTPDQPPISLNQTFSGETAIDSTNRPAVRFLVAARRRASR